MYSCHVPRVLVISAAAINGNSGTGVTLGNLFRTWPTDKLAQIHSDTVGPDTSICARDWRLSPGDVPAYGLAKTIVELFRKVASPKTRELPQMPLGLNRCRLRTAATAWLDLIPYNLSLSFWQWLRTFSPEVVLSNLASIRQVRLTLSVVRQCDCSLIPFFHDDWPSTQYAGSRLTVYPRKVLVELLRQCLSRAPVGMGNSHAMAVDYTRRYGIPFEPFMNCVPVPQWVPEPPTPTQIRFVYCGGLGLGRALCLQDVAHAIQQAVGRKVKPELVIYAPERDLLQHRAAFASNPAVRLGGSISQQRMPEAFRAAHVLVHVESFEPYHRAYTRLSFSTKLPGYLAAGRPILAYGPPEQASVEYLRGTGAVVVTEPNSPDLRLQIQRLCEKEPLRRELGQRSWRTAFEHHEADRVRERFKAVLCRAACPKESEH